MKRELGYIGLGRMGASIVENLLDKSASIVVYNRTKEITDEFLLKRQNDVGRGRLKGVYSLEAVAQNLELPRVIWIMIKAGDAVDKTILNLIPYINKGDVIIDGGNSFYKDSIRRANELSELGIGYLDAGTSGGISGARNGACIMIGGEKEVFEKAEWVFKKASCSNGYMHVGDSGSGHFTKMVHNFTEYGMEQVLAEGVSLLKKGMEQFGIIEKESEICRLWNNGSIIESRLLKDLAVALEKGIVDSITGEVGGGETGEWASLSAKELKVPVPACDIALNQRYYSRMKDNYSGKLIAGMRNVFGEHEVRKK